MYQQHSSVWTVFLIDDNAFHIVQGTVDIFDLYFFHGDSYVIYGDE